MNGLLIQEPPLQVLPSLACKVGLNEAIILQQFHYWLQRSNNVKDGHKWIYNSYSEWHKQFPFWKSKNTLISAIKHLEDMRILISGNYNKAKFDKTKWYRIDYEKLQLLEKSQPFTKNWYTSNQELVNANTKNWETNTNRIPETTTENNSSSTDVGNNQNAFEKYQIYVGMLSGRDTPIFIEYVHKLGDEVVCYAIDNMLSQTATPNFNYLNQILKKYERLGIHTVEQAEELEKKHQDKRKPKKKAVKRTNEPDEEWGGW